MKETFEEWDPTTKSYVMLQHINAILEKYEELGYRLTLRQLYYQLVSGDFIPNTMSEYKKLMNVVSRGRLAGMIDWQMIEDRVREPVKNNHWDSPKEIVAAAARQYYRSRWKGQDSYVEVWCEKDAISNIIEPVCKKWDVIFMANRGYSSLTAMYEAYQRFDYAEGKGKKLALIYLGDHDPSGMDMDRDIKSRMELFLQDVMIDIIDFPFERVALTMQQIEEFEPPENPAKVTDSRYEVYSDSFGDSSWELDALEPTVLSEIVESAILKYVDMPTFRGVEDVEQNHKDKLFAMLDEIDFEE